MTAAQRALVAIALAGLACLYLAARGAAAPPRPAPLTVAGAEGTWHWNSAVAVGWPPALSTEAAFATVRLRDADGAVVAAARGPAQAGRVRGLFLPRRGLYTAEAWLEDADGTAGGTATTLVGFDDVAPSPVQVQGPSGWIGRDATPVLRLTHPAPPLPLSGLRGYAVSIDRDPAGVPCGGRPYCSHAETTLAGGEQRDALRLENLPRGVVYAHAVAISGSGMRSTGVGTAALRVDLTPPTATLAGVPEGWSRSALTLSARATDSLSGMTADGPGGPYTALEIDDGLPRTTPGATATATLAEEGVHRIAYYGRDAAGNVTDPVPVEIARIDRTPPRVSFANGQSPVDPELIVARVVDSLSGASTSRGSIAIRPAHTRSPFAPLPTANRDGALLARWDSDAYPRGVYELRVTGFDAAGNAAESVRRANGTAMMVSNPLKAPTSLRSAFGWRRLVWQSCAGEGPRRSCESRMAGDLDERPTTRRVGDGRLRVGGLLTLASGAPLSGAAVRITETFAGRARPRVTLVRSDGSGAFRARLGAGASRRVEFSYAGDALRSRSAGRTLVVAVRGSVRMSASTHQAVVGGAPVVFRGSVADPAEIPPHGKEIELQFRLPGLPWTQFRTIRTDAHGRYRYPYRFSDDDSRGVRFEMRAFAPAEAGWPYEPGASRPVVVVGR